MLKYKEQWRTDFGVRQYAWIPADTAWGFAVSSDPGVQENVVLC